MCSYATFSLSARERSLKFFPGVFFFSFKMKFRCPVVFVNPTLVRWGEGGVARDVKTSPLHFLGIDS